MHTCIMIYLKKADMFPGILFYETWPSKLLKKSDTVQKCDMVPSAAERLQTTCLVPFKYRLSKKSTPSWEV